MKTPAMSPISIQKKKPELESASISSKKHHAHDKREYQREYCSDDDTNASFPQKLLELLDIMLVLLLSSHLIGSRVSFFACGHGENTYDRGKDSDTSNPKRQSEQVIVVLSIVAKTSTAHRTPFVFTRCWQVVQRGQYSNQYSVG